MSSSEKRKQYQKEWYQLNKERRRKQYQQKLKEGKGSTKSARNNPSCSFIEMGVS